MSTEKKQSERQTGADIVVKTLEQRDVKWVFGVPGREDRQGFQYARRLFDQDGRLPA